MDFWLTERWDGKVTYDGGVRTPDKAEAPDLIGLSEPIFADIESGIQRCGYENLDEVVYGDEF
jgi:hypothetical protein